MKKSVLSKGFLIVLISIMLLHVQDVTAGVTSGLILWYRSIVPALFPFMVLTSLLASGDGIGQMIRPVSLLLKPVLGLSPHGCFILFSGLLCGYPLGAKLCADFYSSQRITRSEALYLLSICNHASPMFVLGFVYPLFQSYIRPWEFLLCIYVPICMIAMISRSIYCKNPGKQEDPVILPEKKENETSFSGSLLDQMILSSVENLCKIGGYVVLFSVVIQMIQSSRQIPDTCKLMIVGMMEISTGIRQLSCQTDPTIRFVTSAACLSFGGLSGMFQTNSVLQSAENRKKAGLSIRPYCLWKIIQACLSAGIAYAICRSH